jgi:peptidyl-prolyl cis-trans isomerase C
MAIRINGKELTDAAIEAEIANHAQAERPLDEALRVLAIQQIVLDEAADQGIDVSNPEQATAELLDRNVTVREATAEECRRHYDANTARFTVGELVEVSHILFQVTPSVDLDLLRRKAGDVLERLRLEPDSFEALAAEYSNCPSSRIGGSLGQISRGDTVPEFERAAFGAQDQGLIGRLIETRFGLHIVRIDRRIQGRLLPFEQVQGQIAQALGAALADRAARDFVSRLVAAAQIEGIVLEPGGESLLPHSHADH